MSAKPKGDPVVVTDSHGRARLSHGLPESPIWVLLRVGYEAPAPVVAITKIVVDDFDAETVGFRVLRSDTGEPLRSFVLPVHMSVR